MTISPDIFRSQATRRFGTRNPERMDLPFWLEMVRSGMNAWQAKEKFARDPVTRAQVEEAPVWTFDRFGCTRTRLSDGSVVCVAGEHEDYGDPDFCIYNDVITFRPDGGIEIYGYPPDLFPPTDFHTATLVGDDLYLIGSLGYAENRAEKSRAQVLVLNLRNFKMRLVSATGDNPGWISCHRAKLVSPTTIAIWGGQTSMGSELLDNEGAYELDTAIGRWSRLAEPPEKAVKLPADLHRLKPIDYDEAHLAADILRRVTPPGHGVFGIDLWPVAEDSVTNARVVQVLDGTGRYGLCDAAWDDGREELPEPKIWLFESFDKLLAGLVHIDSKRWSARR